MADNRPKSRYLVWLLLSLPAIWIMARYLTDVVSYGQVIHATGQWSVGILLATLIITPLRRIFPRATWPRKLVAYRRALGVASFGYAGLHTIVYLHRKWGSGLIVEEAAEPAYLTGWIALVIFLALAATSNNRSVRMLGRGWKMLHRTVYIATALTFAHWILVIFNPVAAWVCLAAVVIFETVRFLRR
ncbi:sulfite oxidase heme-binding subunit YedZ [Parvularcula sp. IMCC14364]|uniref:sulfite oxidase heme-binding subunit YedZ n=1 Tax=Parvularcula sp. IMCC14364 TaxID=3067902 RepID=UPI0027414EF0|nr:ferric reductase-like transmembrane domain-containing protein [Parvularcula sp. IMCC14364]